MVVRANDRSSEMSDNQIQDDAALDDAELEAVSGGTGDAAPKPYIGETEKRL